MRRLCLAAVLLTLVATTGCKLPKWKPPEWNPPEQPYFEGVEGSSDDYTSSKWSR